MGSSDTPVQERLMPSEIHLWLAFYDELGDQALPARYRELLNTAEREQELRFHFAHDRRRYLVTRALVRTVLSRYCPVEPRDWIFRSNEYGRPEAVNAGGRDACLSFNISHTRSLIVLGVTMRAALGVDVENIEARQACLDVADRYFAPTEVTALSATARERQQYRFFEYWTFKEAYIKARGMGLSLPLDKFSFHYEHDHAVEIRIDPELGDTAARWQFWQLRPRPEYLVAVCAERPLHCAPRLIVRKTVPMSSDEELTLGCIRASHSRPAHQRE